VIVTFFNASGIDLGNFLNADLKSKILSLNHATSIAKMFAQMPFLRNEMPIV
jgi:hypothetical protein